MSSRLKISLALLAGACGLTLAGANLPVDTQLTIRTKLGKRTQPHWIVPADSKIVKTEGGSGLIRLFGGLVGCVGFGTAMHLAGTDEREQKMFWQKQGIFNGIQLKEHEASAEIWAGARLKKLQMEAQADVDYHSLQLQQKFRDAIGFRPVVQQPILPHGKPGTLDDITTPGDKVEAEVVSTINQITDCNLGISRQIAVKTLNSLAGINTSIFLAAPTRCGKTRTLYKWLGDLTTRFPQAEVYVIAQKYEDFPGVPRHRFAIFDPLFPEESMKFLDEVYEKLQDRKSKPANEETYRDRPIKIILEDWFATYQCLVQKRNAQLWEDKAAKLGSVATVGGQYNVGYFICTQTFNIASSGVADSNIRLNLALIAQGLVRTTKDGEEQGSYGVIEQMINNSNVIANNKTRDRLASDLSLLIPDSMIEQTPIILSTIGNPVLGLMPKIDSNGFTVNEVSKAQINTPTAPTTAPDSTDTAESNSAYLDPVYNLEFDLSKPEPSEPGSEPLNRPQDKTNSKSEPKFTPLNLTREQAIELIQRLRTELNQTQLIEKLWDCKKGGSEAWKRAYAEFKELTRENEE